MPHDYKTSIEKNNMENAVVTVGNEFGTLMISLPSINFYSGALFRNFTLLDLFEVLNIIKSQNKNIFVPKIDLKSTLTNFNGKSFFDAMISAEVDTEYFHIINN
jgi:hypothetical protein